MTQEELSQGKITTYKNPETGVEYNSKQPLDSQRTRGNQISYREEGTDTNLKVGIKDIDETILYYFQEVIQPRVSVNGKYVPVPITYASPEKWKAVQREGIYRDKTGKRQLPVILFKRDSLSKIRSMGNKISATRPYVFYTYGSSESRRNRYSRFENEVVPKEKVYNITVIPDYVTLNYSCTILTDYVEQMNTIIEDINFSNATYWGNPEKFKFQAFIDSFKTDIATNQNEDRTVKTDFSIKLNGYIVPDSPNTYPYTSLRRYGKTNVSTEIDTK